MKATLAAMIFTAVLARIVAAQDFSKETLTLAGTLVNAARHGGLPEGAAPRVSAAAQAAGPKDAASLDPHEIGMVGEWRNLKGCRGADGGRQNITSTMNIFADYTAEVVILSYRQADRTCQGQRIGRTVGRYAYSLDGPSAVEPGAYRTTWTIKSVKVTANNGDVWDRTDEFGGKVSRNTMKIVDQPGETYYFVSADDDADGKLQSKPSYALVRP
ncbi:MAG: hypothetical protein HY077_04560 [Elusimicrobia bacterium]|nr:hypothetical protein [Elusimicrobiota bacterium]